MRDDDSTDIEDVERGAELSFYPWRELYVSQYSTITVLVVEKRPEWVVDSCAWKLKKITVECNKCQTDGSCGLIIWNIVASCGSARFHVWEWYVKPTVNCGLIWCQWWEHAISTPLMMVYFPALFLEFWYLSNCLEYLSSCLVDLSWTCCLICLWLISKFIMQVVMYRWRVNLSIVRWIVWRQWRRSLHCFLTWNSGPFWYSTAIVVRTGIGNT